MTNDPVDEVVLAYLEYLDGDGPEPSLDHLNASDRALAEELIKSAIVGRGIDPYESRPSINALVAGTGLQDLFEPAPAIRLSIDAIRTDVVSALGANAEPIEDGAALNEGIRSDAVICYRALRLRLQFRDDISSPSELAKVDPRAAAGPLYGRFPETAGVILVIGDPELSSVPVGPFDIEDYIGAPDGHLHTPHIYRPVLPLFDTLRSYVDEAAPDLTSTTDLQPADFIDVEYILQLEADNAITAVADEGRRARTEAKRLTWAGHSDTNHKFVTSVLSDAWNTGLTLEDLRSRIETTLEAA